MRDFDHTSDIWPGKFLSWAQNITQNHSSHITPEHIQQINQNLLFKSLPPGSLQKMCLQLNWPTHACQKLVPQISLLHKAHEEFLKDLQYPKEFWDTWGRSQDVRQPLIKLKDHTQNYFNCMTHLWERAQPQKKSIVLRDFFKDKSVWVFKSVFHPTPKWEPVSWLRLAQTQPWWSNCANDFWFDAPKILRTPDLLTHLDIADRPRLMALISSSPFQDLLGVLPPTTPQARGVFEVLSHWIERPILNPTSEPFDVSLDWLWEENSKHPSMSWAIELNPIITSLYSKQNLDQELALVTKTVRSRRF